MQEMIYILGSGAVGFPLSAYLAAAGRRVLAVRTSRADVPRGRVTITATNNAAASGAATPGIASVEDAVIRASVETVSLAQLDHLDGLIVIANKAHANPAVAQALKAKRVNGPLILLQNGLGVERPFIEAGFAPIGRCVLYVTAQVAAQAAEQAAEHAFSFRPVTASPIGLIAARGADGADGAGDACNADVQRWVDLLSSAHFPFRVEANIERETWKKAIINTAFNSICPLLDVDNGVFVRDAAVAALAREVVRECVTLTDRLGLGLSEGELMAQIERISARSDGQLISTLQDIRQGRPTEIEFLNVEIARVAAALQPALALPKIDLLGRLTLAKSLIHMQAA